MLTTKKADAYVNEGQMPERHRSGHPGFVPYEAFETADAPLLICCGNDRLFAKLAIELGRADWLQDQRFLTNRARLVNKSILLDEMLSLLKANTRADWLKRFNEAGIPCAPVHTVPEAISHPQVEALGMMQQVPNLDFQLTALPLSIDGVRPAHCSGAPQLGEHNLTFGVPAMVSSRDD